MRENNVVHLNRRDDLERERLGPLGRGVRLAIAALAIGQAFFIQGEVTLWHALAVAVGAFLAVEAIVGWGPLAAWHAAQREWLRERRAARRAARETPVAAEAEARPEDEDVRRAA